MLWWTLQQLKSKEASTRLKAVEKLAEDVDAKVAEALVAALGDPDELVRKAAAKALGETHDESLLRPICDALRDRTPHIREAAADALRQLHSPNAIPALAPLLADANYAVRWQTARALEALGWTPTNKSEAAHFAVSRGRIEEAASHGAEAVEALALVFQSGAYHQRRAAVAALCQIPDARVVKALMLALKDTDDQVRSAAVDALCRMGEPSSAEALMHALNDGHKHVRAVAAEALGQIGGPRAVEPLLRRAKDRQWEVREAVCIALGKLKDSRAYEALTLALKDPDREVREAAVRGLGFLGDSRAIGPMLAACVDEHESVRKLASATLSSLDMHWERTEAARSAVPLLQEALKHGQYWPRQSAADALNRISQAQSGEAAPVTAAPAPETPVGGMIEPAHQRKQVAVDVFIELLVDFDEELRFAGAEALGRLGQAGAIAPLTRALKDTRAGVRKAAAQAIETLRGKPTPETNLILRGEDFPL